MLLSANMARGCFFLHLFYDISGYRRTHNRRGHYDDFGATNFSFDFHAAYFQKLDRFFITYFICMIAELLRLHNTTPLAARFHFAVLHAGTWFRHDEGAGHSRFSSLLARAPGDYFSKMSRYGHLRRTTAMRASPIDVLLLLASPPHLPGCMRSI